MILAIDQGTTGTTCLVFDGDGRIRGRAYSEFRQHFPRPGWVEHDANEIWDVTRRVASHALADAKADPGSLDAIGITNQRETVVAWDPDSGEPVHNALVWQDRRTAARCDELREEGYEPLVRERTGLVLDPYFSGTKIEWLLRNVDAAAGAVFGTIDSWLVFKLTGRHATDLTNASRTMLFDIRERRWDPELCELLGVDGVEAPRAAAVGGRLRDDLGVRGGGAGRRDRRRPAGGAVRPGLPAPRDGEEHLRHGQLRAPQRGERGPGPRRRTPDHGGLGARRRGHVRARGGRVRHRRRGAVAARRARAGRRGGRDRGHGRLAGLQRRRLLRPRAHRPRLAALGPVRARDDRGPHPRHLPRPSGARGARGDRLPDGRRRPRPGAGGGRAALASCAPTGARSPTGG